MDSNEVKRRFVNDVGAPQVVKPKSRKIIEINTEVSQDTNPLLPEAEPTSMENKTINPSSAAGEKVIAPLDTNSATAQAVEQPEKGEVIKEEISVPIVDPLPDSKAIENPQPEVAVSEPSVSEESEDKLAGAYKTTDALPEANHVSAITKDTMQDPKIFDTVVYHVPIKETHHTHGSPKMAFTIGTLFALIVVVGTVYVMYQIGS